MDELSLIDPNTGLATLNTDDVARANYEVLRRAGKKESTRAQYAQTEKRWAAWCATNGLNPLNFEVVYIDAFFQTLKDRYSRTTLRYAKAHDTKVIKSRAKLGQ